MMNSRNLRPLIKTLGLLILTVLLIPTGFSCSEAPQKKATLSEPSEKAFHDYWFQGLAEISRFQLEQVRYGEIRKGDAVLIFVTEEFLLDKQVKSEQGRVPGSVPILKLNFIKKFMTGIYPYSIMSSMFTPIELTKHPKTLKVTTSIQEWCGHTFTQINLRKNRYQVMTRSYYMGEADRNDSVENVQLEDNIWALIRIDPASLMTGDIELIPGSQFSRLKHIDQTKQNATASLDVNDDLSIYHIQYSDIPRALTFRFKTHFPFEIMGWEETSSREKDGGQAILKTRATRTHTMLIDYWNKKSLSDTSYRKKLGLP